MTADFSKLWADPDTPAREKTPKRLLAHLIEDVTLIKMPVEGTTEIHVRFKGGKIQTLTTVSPKSSAQQVKTQRERSIFCPKATKLPPASSLRIYSFSITSR